MGTTQSILHGGRAQLMIDGKIVGIFTSCQWGVNYDAIPSFILGRMSAAEITYVGQDAISVNATGFRVLNAGAFQVSGLPKLQDLLSHQDISVAIFDRQTGLKVMSVVGVRPVGFNSGVAARSISDYSVAMLGLRLSDESGAQGESAGATDLLQGS